MIIKRRESFLCRNCGFYVAPNSSYSRNHCPRCFVSYHLDNLPGDRKSLCGGRMYPYAYKWNTNGIKISFFCSTCGHIHNNIQAEDDDIGNLDARITEYHHFYEMYLISHNKKFTKKKRSSS